MLDREYNPRNLLIDNELGGSARPRPLTH